MNQQRQVARSLRLAMCTEVVANIVRITGFSASKIQRDLVYLMDVVDPPEEMKLVFRNLAATFEKFPYFMEERKHRQPFYRSLPKYRRRKQWR